MLVHIVYHFLSPREMTQREVRSVGDLKLQEELRKNAWESATMLLTKAGAEVGSDNSGSTVRRK